MIKLQVSSASDDNTIAITATGINKKSNIVFSFLFESDF